MITINEFNERVFSAGGAEVVEVSRGNVYRVTGAYGDGSHYFHPETNKVYRVSGYVVPEYTRTGHGNTEHDSVRSVALNAIGHFEEPAPVTVEVSTLEVSHVVSRFEIDPVDFEREMEVPLDEATTETIYDYGISHTNSDVVQDSPEGVSEYLSHDIF